MQGIRGLTLMELLVTVALVAALVTLGVPAFSGWIRHNALVAEANRFVSTLHLGRSEAIKRGRTLTIGRQGDWANGWTVFVDLDEDGQRDSGEVVLRRAGPLREGFTLVGNFHVADSVSYRATGQTRKPSGAFQMGTFTLCDDTGTANARHARAIVISSTGRPRVSRAQADIDKNGC